MERVASLIAAAGGNLRSDCITRIRKHEDGTRNKFVFVLSDVETVNLFVLINAIMAALPGSTVLDVDVSSSSSSSSSVSPRALVVVHWSFWRLAVRLLACLAVLGFALSRLALWHWC
mgnify:CR=1 FL=1